LAMMYFWRSCNNDRASLPTTPPAAITDTVVKTDTVATVDTVVTPAPVPAADATPAQPRRRTAARRASSSGSRNVALTTTSSFSAQERAAELKADGNPNAHVRTRQKNGVTVYEVRTRK
ncbi:MAG TPA: hypothetical protein VFH43_10550, partial [Candidatus Kapabacteria bacterium]|nr:hypothetical protein [Candidatus Kapabacteria bacterium]